MGSFALALAFILDISPIEKIIVIILAVLVLVVEIINTAFERLLDKIINEHHTDVAIIKELLAGAVFIFSLSAFLIGIWIFGKALIN